LRDAYTRANPDGDIPNMALSRLFEFVIPPKLAYVIPREELHVWGTAEDLLADATVHTVQVP
jgi:hypothetical protein